MEKNNKYETQGLLTFLWRWKWVLLIVSIVAAIASSIVALSITPLYKSTVIIFPAKTSTVSFSEQRNVKDNTGDFGEEEQAEQLLQILQSSKIRNRIIQKYNLMKHYDIDTSAQYKFTLLAEEYESKISFERTRYGSIKIDVLDHDKDTAMLIANDIAQLVDTVKNEMIQERTRAAFEIVKRKYVNLQEELNSLVDTISKLNALGVVGDEERASLYQSLGNATSQTEKDYIKNLIEINTRYGSQLDRLSELREFKIEKLTDLQNVYEQAESDATAEFTHKFTVEAAAKAEKKAYPIRWLIVVVSTMAAFIFTVFVILVLQKINEIRSQQP